MFTLPTNSQLFGCIWLYLMLCRRVIGWFCGNLIVGSGVRLSQWNGTAVHPLERNNLKFMQLGAHFYRTIAKSTHRMRKGIFNGHLPPNISEVNHIFMNQKYFQIVSMLLYAKFGNSYRIPNWEMRIVLVYVIILDLSEYWGMWASAILSTTLTRFFSPPYLIISGRYS